MKVNQISTIMKYTPLQHFGYIFKIKHPGTGIVEEMKNFIFERFSINREDYIHPDCHVIYGTNDNTEYYQAAEWDNYIVCHGMVINIEK